MIFKAQLYCPLLILLWVAAFGISAYIIGERSDTGLDAVSTASGDGEGDKEVGAEDGVG